MAVQAVQKAKRRTNPRPVSAVTSRKVVVEFPQDLLAQTEQVAAQMDTDRSKLIRSAVESYLETIRRKHLEMELAEGYAANARLDRELCREFAHIDAETI